MARFTKMPVTIEAVQITDDTFDAAHPNPEHIVGVTYDPSERCAFIDTLEGRMRADMGDWIIRGIKGELYPCKPDIFEQTYMHADLAEEMAQYDKPPESLDAAFAKAINRFSAERDGGNTPDFHLGAFLADVLGAAGRLIDRREEWYGRGHEPLGLAARDAAGDAARARP